MVSGSHDRLRWHTLAAGVGLVLGIALVVGILLALGNGTGPHPLPGQPAVHASSGATLSSAVSNSTLAVTPPGGWGVDTTNTLILLTPPNQDAVLHLESRRLKHAVSSVAAMQAITDSISQENENVQVCGDPETSTVTNGPQGVAVGLCYTIVPQQGQAFRVFHVLQIGTGEAPNAFYDVEFLMHDTSTAITRFMKVALPVSKTVRWKLFRPARG